MAGSPQTVTLVGGAVSRVVFTVDYNEVEVLSDGADDVWFNFEPAGGVDPTAAGDGVFWLPAGGPCWVVREPPTNKPTVVALLSAGTPTVQVTGL